MKRWFWDDYYSFVEDDDRRCNSNQRLYGNQWSFKNSETPSAAVLIENTGEMYLKNLSTGEILLIADDLPIGPEDCWMMYVDSILEGWEDIEKTPDSSEWLQRVLKEYDIR